MSVKQLFFLVTTGFLAIFASICWLGSGIRSWWIVRKHLREDQERRDMIRTHLLDPNGHTVEELAEKTDMSEEEVERHLADLKEVYYIGAVGAA